MLCEAQRPEQTTRALAATLELCVLKTNTHIYETCPVGIYSLICTGELKRAASLLSEKGWMEWLMRNPNFASKLVGARFAFFVLAEVLRVKFRASLGKNLLEKSPNGW
jgi:hypothetical protein